ncbi:hypothetical protein Dcar01_00279 [Deinococcus carri]|uniref:Fluoride ion transporter CrcB n=1 Tax=Deinococcus carri TaxID=1211323 RepID=A0ABP9W6I7_9DEIO
MKASVTPRTGWQALANLLKRGALYGGAASVLGALLGDLLIQHGRHGVLTGLNLAGILLCILAGSFAQGSFGVQSGVAMSQARLGTAAPQMQWPLASMLVALLAAGVCFLLAWLGSGWR